MSIEALDLALTTIVRPSAVAAVVGILSTRTPTRLLWPYVLAGLAFTLAFGAIVVVALRGLTGFQGMTATKPWVEIGLGILLLGYGIAVWAGWLPRPQAPGATVRTERMGRLRTKLREPTRSTTALAGVVTHLPGLIYLAALNAIVNDNQGVVDGLVQVAIYNAIWFSIPIAALVLSVRRPSLPRELLATASTVIRSHRRLIIVVASGVVGTYLVVSGVVSL